MRLVHHSSRLGMGESTTRNIAGFALNCSLHCWSSTSAWSHLVLAGRFVCNVLPNHLFGSASNSDSITCHSLLQVMPEKGVPSEWRPMRSVGQLVARRAPGWSGLSSVNNKRLTAMVITAEYTNSDRLPRAAYRHVHASSLAPNRRARKLVAKRQPFCNTPRDK